MRRRSGCDKPKLLPVRLASIPALVNQFVGLQIRPTDHEPPIEIDVATVRTVTGRRFGLEFVRIRQEQETRLRRILVTLLHGR